MSKLEKLEAVAEAAASVVDGVPTGWLNGDEKRLLNGLLAALEALDDFTPDEPEGRVYSEGPSVGTVRARVCVVTDEDGVWVANGDRHMEDARIQREAMNLFTSGSHLRVTWLEGPVAVPQPQTIEGEVSRG